MGTRFLNTRLTFPLLALAGIILMGVLSLMDTTPAFAADGAGVLRKVGTYVDKNVVGVHAGAVLDESISGPGVRTITFTDTIPTGTTCWDAGATGYESSVKGCATVSEATADDGTPMWDVTYGTDGAYPKFPADSSWLFSGSSSLSEFSGLVSIHGLDKIDTSNVTDMRHMFYGCRSLTQLDVSKFDMSNVTDTDSMFGGCGSLTSLDVSKWDTSSVKTVYNMFYFCSSLTQLDVSKWDTSNVTDMGQMFFQCNSLTSLDVSKWDTSNVTDMGWMFPGCSSLTFLDVSEWDTSKVTGMRCMFADCPKLTFLDVSKWDTSKVTGMSGMFSGCSGLASLDVSKWDTSNVTNMSYMFDNCRSLASLDVSNFDTSNVTYINYMLGGLDRLQELKLGGKFTWRPGLAGYDGDRGEGETDGPALGGPDGSATRAGYANIGKWRNMDTGKVYDSASEIPANTAATYTPFEPITYTVQFDRNAPDATGSMDPQSFAYDVAQNLTANTFTRAGYEFTGWNTKPDGTGDSVTPDSEVALKPQTTTLYAQWKALPASLAYDANRTDATGSTPDTTGVTDQTVTVSENGYKVDGWTFTGWNTKPDGTGDNITPDSEVALKPQTTTLYAQWTRDTDAAGGAPATTASLAQTGATAGTVALMGALLVCLAAGLCLPARCKRHGK